MSQPCDRACKVPQPGQVDKELGEFWVGDPWEIFQKHNLSAFEQNRMFLNVGGRNFLDVSYLSGADTDGDSRAVVPVDVNHDGRMDLVLRQVGGGPLQLYENRFPGQGHFLKVTLRGRESNSRGIGARLIASVGSRQIVREMYPINTFRSQAPSVVHFGLGDAEQVDELTVRWPSGLEQKFHDLPADRHVALLEGKQTIETVEPGEQIPP